MNWCRFSIALVVILATTVAEAAEPQPRRLTADGLVKTSPVFVDRSGTELVYVVEDIATRMRLMRLRLSDGTSTPLHPDETRSELEPAFSPDGRLLSFIQSRGNLNLVVVIQELASKREAVINVGGGFAGPRSPAFTPDGTRVVYSMADESRQHLYIVPSEGGEPRRIVESQGVNNWPDVSPDGKSLVFGSSRDADYELYRTNIDGTNPRRLTNRPGLDARPRLSPDGKRIACTSIRDGNYDVYVMNADGTGERRVTNHPERDDYATWHPDGKRLVFVGERDGRHDLYEIAVPN
jgi:Tol biopolymer transport system component